MWKDDRGSPRVLAGKHEPPTNTSFYLSLATSTLRAAILVAAVVLGVFVLARAFQGNDGVPAGTAPNQTPTSPATTTTKPSPTKPPRKGRIKGVVVQVLNATDITGLAGSTTETLEGAGYTAEIPADAPEDSDQTIIYYRPDSKPDAELMQERFFDQAVLKKATVDQSPGVQLTVVLGSDFSPS